MRIAATLLAVASLVACADGSLPFPEGARRVEDPALSEISGLVASRRQPDVLWGINDSGSLPRLFRVGRQGEALGRVWLLGVWLRDAEALARWHDDGRDWLLLGDVGDNRDRRDEVVVHAVAEPAPGQRWTQPAWSLRLRFPDGARDVEAMAVDPLRQDLLLLSKRDRPARLYRVPLAARASGQVAAAEFIGSPVADALAGEVTGLDLSDDGRQLLVLTYRGLYRWQREPSESWTKVLARQPQRLPMPVFAKAEAMALGASADEVWVGSEKQPTPLWSHRLSSPSLPRGSVASAAP